MKSIIQDEAVLYQCYICALLRDDTSWKRELECHHVFYGWGRRKIADRYGLTVMLCPHHHRGDINGSRYAVHGKDEMDYDTFLKRKGQEAWERKYTDHPGTEAAHKEFRELMGKNYL